MLLFSWVKGHIHIHLFSVVVLPESGPCEANQLGYFVHCLSLAQSVILKHFDMPKLAKIGWLISIVAQVVTNVNPQRERRRYEALIFGDNMGR